MVASVCQALLFLLCYQYLADFFMRLGSIHNLRKFVEVSAAKFFGFSEAGKRGRLHHGDQPRSRRVSGVRQTGWEEGG